MSREVSIRTKSALTCPRVLAGGRGCPAPGAYLLTKCCLLEDHVDAQAGSVVVPWGASFGHLRDAQRLLAGAATDPGAGGQP